MDSHSHDSEHCEHTHSTCDYVSDQKLNEYLVNDDIIYDATQIFDALSDFHAIPDFGRPGKWREKRNRAAGNAFGISVSNFSSVASFARPRSCQCKKRWQKGHLLTCR